MATIDGLNSVFEKREGTGQAYILPNSQAASVFANGMDDMRKQQEAKRLAAAKLKLDFDNENYKTLGDFKLGDHWGLRAKELQSDYDEASNYGLEVIKRGGNLRTDATYKQMVNRVLSKARASGDMQKGYDVIAAEVGKNPDAYENGIEVLQQFQNASLDDYMTGKFKPPALVPRYSLADAVKASDGKVSYLKNKDGTWDTTMINKSGIVDQAKGSLDSPEAQYQLKQNGADDKGPYLRGFPTVNAKGETFYNTEGKDFEREVLTTLKDDPNFPTYLKEKGYDVSSVDAVMKSAFAFAKKQNHGLGKYVDDYFKQVAGGGTTERYRDFSGEVNRRANELLEISKANQAIAQQQNKRAEEKHKVDMKEAAAKALKDRPDEIAKNVTTNLVTPQYDKKGKNMELKTRLSTSLSAANVGSSKHSFLPTISFNPETGEASNNSASMMISGGQVHIKRVIKFNGAMKILDDESYEKLKKGTYVLNKQKVPKDHLISYEEMLYGQENVQDENSVSTKIIAKKVIIPVTGQALDQKFDKGYNREKMYQGAVDATKDWDEKVEIMTQYQMQVAPGISYQKAKKIAYNVLKEQ